MLKPIIILILSVPMIFSGFAMASEKGDNHDDIELLNKRILHLQQQVLEMQQKHDTEIAALREQINELAAEAGKKKEKEDITSLRELAKAAATETAEPEEPADEITYRSGALGLQSLNPEISVTGDFLF